MTPEQREHWWTDLQACCRTEYFEHYIDFDVREAVWGTTIKKDGTRVEYRELWGDGRPAESWEDAEIIAKGTIKWDGCSNLMYHKSDETVHYCGPEDVRIHMGAMLAVYELAAEYFGQQHPYCWETT